MKRIVIILISSLVIFALHAQDYKIEGDIGNQRSQAGANTQLEQSLLDCIYSYRIYDPIKKAVMEDYKILEICKDVSLFSSYGFYRVDSLIKIHYPDGITFNEYHKLSAENKPSLEAIVKDFTTSTLKNYDKVFIDYYVYEEEIPDMKWNLNPSETKDICGYRCNKATSTFRGRNWTAWYCNDIPQSNGPWKFGNLPGLILKIEDDDHEHIFEAITIRKGVRVAAFYKSDHIKTTREKFNEALAEYKNNPRSFISATPVTMTDKEGNNTKVPNNKMFFNPIEKE